MKKIIFVMLAVMAAACETHDDSAMRRQCGAYSVGMEFCDDGDTLRADINGDTVDLHHTVAASGARYDGVLNDTAVTLWGKGDTWTLFLGQDEAFECK